MFSLLTSQVESDVYSSRVVVILVPEAGSAESSTSSQHPGEYSNCNVIHTGVMFVISQLRNCRMNMNCL